MVKGIALTQMKSILLTRGFFISQFYYSATADASAKDELPPFPPRFSNAGGGQVRAKEVIIICMAIMLLIFSIMLFFKHWKKNYRDINQLAYSAYLYPDEEEEEVHTYLVSKLYKLCFLKNVYFLKGRASSSSFVTNLLPLPSQLYLQLPSQGINPFCRGRKGWRHVPDYI
jgi:hypothetical protein